MDNFVDFLFGGPKKILGTVIVGGAIVAGLWPEQTALFLSELLGRFWIALQPLGALAKLGLTLAIAYFGFRIMFSGGSGGGGGGDGKGGRKGGGKKK